MGEDGRTTLAAAVPVGTKPRPLRSQTKSVSSHSGEAGARWPERWSRAGDTHEGAVGEWDGFGPAEVLVKDVPEAQLIEQGADDEDGSPVRGVSDLGIGGIRSLTVGLASEKFAELGEKLDQQVLATEIGDDALFDLTIFSVGFDDADIFVDGTA